MCVQRYPVEKGEWMDTHKSDGHFRSPIVCTYIPQLVGARKLSSIAEFGYNSEIITNHTRILRRSSSGLSASTVVIRCASSSALELEIGAPHIDSA